MSAQADPFSPPRLPATLAAMRTLSLTAAIVSVVLLVLIVAIEAILPVDDMLAVRDGIGLALASVASWALFAVALRVRTAYPRATNAYGLILAIMIGLGGGAFVLNFVLDLVLVPGTRVLALAAPISLVLCVVIPGVYLAFSARGIARAAS